MEVEQLPNRILTKRQSELTKQIAEGKTTPQIAAESFRTESSVNKGISGAMSRLGANTRAHLVSLAIHKGIIAIRSIILVICVYGTVQNEMDARNMRHVRNSHRTSLNNSRNWEIRI